MEAPGVVFHLVVLPLKEGRSGVQVEYDPHGFISLPGIGPVLEELVLGISDEAAGGVRDIDLTPADLVDDDEVVPFPVDDCSQPQPPRDPEYHLPLALLNTHVQKPCLY